MNSLCSKEKYHVLLLLINSKDTNVRFSENNFNIIFGDINFGALVNYLDLLSNQGVVRFVVCESENNLAEYVVSIIDYKRIRYELNSIKYQHRQPYIRRVLVYTMLLLAMFIGIVMVYALFCFPYSELTMLFVVTISVLLTLVSLMIASILRKDRDVNEITQYSEKLKRTIIEPEYETLGGQSGARKAKSADENDALNLMLVNMEEIKAYYTLSKTQAKNSFRLSVWMCVLGFVLLIVAVFIPLLTNGNYEASIITAIGGAIVEVVAGTSLFVYKNSLTQLNHYYESLHDNERFLSTVNLVRKLRKDNQDDMYIEIIRSCLRGVDAVNNENK